MSEHRIDFKEAFEKNTGLNVWPVRIPNDSKYPCIEMSISGGGRNNDSGHNRKISDYRISLVICASTLSECYKYEKILKDRFDDKPFNNNDTKSLIMYFENSVELYNNAQSLYELTVDFSTKTI